MSNCSAARSCHPRAVTAMRGWVSGTFQCSVLMKGNVFPNDRWLCCVFHMDSSMYSYHIPNGGTQKVFGPLGVDVTRVCVCVCVPMLSVSCSDIMKV